MAYVEAHAGLRDHLKTKKVARLLGVPKVQVIGHMLCLWWWCQEYAQDGNLTAFDVDDIAEAAEWDGDAETFVNALLTCGAKGGAGFLTLNSDGVLLVNDWYQYGGKLFVQRAQTAERMRNYRARNAVVTHGNDNDTVSDADVTRNDTVTVTHVTPIDKIRIDNTPTVPADAVPTAPNAPPSLASQFASLVEELKTTPNKSAILHRIYVLCFGEAAAPDYGYLGKVAKQVGGAGRLAQLMFELVTRPPAGDILAYIVAEENGRKKRAQLNGKPTTEQVWVFNPGGDE